MGMHRSRVWWRRAVADQAKSGQTVAAFAASAGLNASTLRWWISEFRRSLPPTGGGFVEVVAAVKDEIPSARSVAPGEGTLGPAAVAIRVGPGVTVVLGSLPPPEYVARLAAAYEEVRS